jgi:hypothetical protein
MRHEPTLQIERSDLDDLLRMVQVLLGPDEAGPAFYLNDTPTPEAPDVHDD